MEFIENELVDWEVSLKNNQEWWMQSGTYLQPSQTSAMKIFCENSR